MKKKAACFVAALAIFAQNGVAITPKLEHILEGSSFYMACITKKPDAQTTEEAEVPANAADAQADNADAVAAPIAAAQSENEAQITALEEKLKEEIVHISPAIFVSCDALAGHLKRKGQHALAQKFEDYAERLYSRNRANMRFEKIFHFDLPENTTPASEVDRHFMVCAKAFHVQIKQQEKVWNIEAHNSLFHQDRPIFFFTRYLFKGFFDNDIDAFKTAYDHAKAKEAFYRDLKDAHSTLLTDPVDSMLRETEKASHDALKICRDAMRKNVQENRNGDTVSAVENKLQGIDMINPCYYYNVPRLHTHLEAKLTKWESRRQALSQLCVEYNIPLE
ncbi:MAG: hypothetical protein ACPGUZ_01530 [Holosporaceae bacterium]